MLYVKQANGRYRPAFESEVRDAHTSYIRDEVRGIMLQSPNDSKRYLMQAFVTYKYEVFCCLFLDNRHRVIEFKPMFFGTIDGATVHSREIIRECLERNAAAIIFAHNHPSGIAEPSDADIKLTRRLQDACKTIDVRVLDHFVVGDDIVSFAERGLL